MDKKRVLVIDNEVDFCILMQFYLSKKNCDVDIAYNQKDAIGIIEHKTPDIVIIDSKFDELINLIKNKIPVIHIYMIDTKSHNETF